MNRPTSRTLSRKVENFTKAKIKEAMLEVTCGRRRATCGEPEQ